MFSAEIYQYRRQILKNTLGSGTVLFLGNQFVGMNYAANTYHFRQDSTFLYYFGIDKPNLCGLIDIDRNQEIIFGDELTMDDVIWEGNQPSLQDLAAQVGISLVSPPQKIKSYLSTNTLYLPPYRAEHKIQLADLLGFGIQEVSEGSEKLIRAVLNQRLHKASEELAEMEKAVNVSAAMHIAAMRATQVGKKEYEIVGEILKTVQQHGCELSYPIIFSVNGQTLHNHYHGNTMQAGQLALGDFGAETPMHYAGDITRTFPVSGKFSTQQAEIYAIVLRCLEETGKSLKANNLYLDHHLRAWEIMAEGLIDLGILRGNPAELANAGVCGLFMPHGLGHHIGLDVHDAENLGEDRIGYREGIDRSKLLGLKSLRMAKELEIGHAITVEPGIYFIPELIDKWQLEGNFKEFINYEALNNYRNFGGIRIEDNYLITATGGQRIGNPIPKTIQEIENELI